MIIKKIHQRDLLIEVFGPVVIGEYGFCIKFDDGCFAPELYNSITNGVHVMKTFKIAQEIGSFTASEIWRIGTEGYKGKADYLQQISALTDTVNKRIAQKKY